MNRTPDATQVARTDWMVYRRLLGHAGPYWKLLLLALFGYLLMSGASIGAAELMKTIIDSLSQKQPGYRAFIPLAMVALIGGRGLGSFVGNYSMSYVSNALVYDLRQLVFGKFMTLPAVYYDTHAGGHLISMITFQVTQVTDAITKAGKIMLEHGLFLIGLVAYLLWMNWKLSLLLLLVAPPIFFIVRYAGRRFKNISRRIQSSMGDVTHVTGEVINGYREVRIFGGEASEQARFQRVSNYNRQQLMKLTATEASNGPAVQLLVSLAMALLMWLALDPTLVDQLSPGGFVAYITAASLLARPAKMLADVQSIIQRGLAAADAIFQMLDQPSEPDSGTLCIERARGDIDYRDVSFGYHNGALPVLKRISFSIPAGKMVALVGRSGSGKSTIVSLLPRFYDHQSGQITIDGIAIEQLRLTSLRAQIAYVSQQITLFNDSVRNNIAYGATAGRSEAEVIEAARRAHALEFIEKLPNGFDTLVGDDGVMLSGGQRQRIAIARAFLKDAPILILDEATSALDTESEQKIQAALEEVMKNRTTLVIAHRLSTIIHADQILVIEGGELLESGSHAELLARNGAYTALYERQFADDAAPVATP